MLLTHQITINVEDFRVDMGTFTLTGPTPLQQDRTCVSGLTCAFNILGKDLALDDTVMVLETCGVDQVANRDLSRTLLLSLLLLSIITIITIITIMITTTQIMIIIIIMMIIIILLLIEDRGRLGRGQRRGLGPRLGDLGRRARGRGRRHLPALLVLVNIIIISSSSSSSSNMIMIISSSMYYDDDNDES